MTVSGGARLSNRQLQRKAAAAVATKPRPNMSGWAPDEFDDDEDEDEDEDDEDEDDEEEDDDEELSSRRRKPSFGGRLFAAVGGLKFLFLYFPMLVLAFVGGLGCGCNSKPPAGGAVDSIGSSFDGTNHQIFLGQDGRNVTYLVPHKLAGKIEILTPEQQLMATQTARMSEEQARADAYRAIAASMEGAIKNADEVAQRARQDAESAILRIVQQQRSMNARQEAPLTQSGSPPVRPAFNTGDSQ